ncbi:unnamed protein product [Chrysoparadoxa australica]
MDEELFRDLDRTIEEEGSIRKFPLQVDPQLLLKWTPLLPNPIPVGYPRFEAERLMKKINLLHPSKRVMAAAAYSHAWCLEELFRRGCPFDVKNGTGYAPLHISSCHGDAECCRVLLNIGEPHVHVNAATSSGFTPLFLAKTTECASLIRAAGGVTHLPEHEIRPAGILDLEVKRPRRSMDDQAEELGRLPFYGQF